MKTTVANSAAYALTDLGIDIITHVPGYGASETFTSYNELNQKRLPVSFHEEPAYSICHGASIAGKRACCIIKAHGIAKAANSALDSLYTDINAGFVILIFEDFKGDHSDNIMETEQLLFGMNFPYEKSDCKNIYNDIVKCFHNSEKRRMPFVLLADADKMDQEVEFERSNDLKKTFTYKRDVLGNVVHPFFADYQYKVFTAKKLNGDPATIKRPELPFIPYGLPDRYKPSANQYQPFFEVFKQYKQGIVCGDTSSSSTFCLPPFEAIDIVTHIGGSIPLAIGTYLAGNKYSWALTGDFGFISAGHMGLIEAANRGIPLKIVIFFNKKAAATGGQSIDKKIMLRLLSAYEPFTKHVYDPTDLIDINNVLDEAVNSAELRIILVHY